MSDFSPISKRPAHWPNEGPLPELEPSEQATYYVLPRRWSLHYALTEKQWRDLRERHKKLDTKWDRCACPKRCKAKALDEQWKYDEATHTKVLIGAAFICGGCHWLKSPPFRIKTWLELQQGVVSLPSKTPHIIDCLGWTQQQLDALRDDDLGRHKAETALLTRLEREVQRKKAVIIPKPPERFLPQELDKLVRPGQIMIVPWRIDLSVLARYGYSENEITEFQQRMYKLAEQRMAGE